MEQDIFEKLLQGEPVDMMSPAYLPAIEHMNKTRKLNFRINQAEPDSSEIPKLEAQLCEGLCRKAASLGEVKYFIDTAPISDSVYNNSFVPFAKSRFFYSGILAV